MMRKKDKVQIWVDPAFKRKLKTEAFNKNTDMLSLTKKLADGDFEDTIFEPLTKNFKRIL